MNNELNQRPEARANRITRNRAFYADLTDQMILPTLVDEDNPRLKDEKHALRNALPQRQLLI